MGTMRDVVEAASLMSANPINPFLLSEDKELGHLLSLLFKCAKSASTKNGP